MRCLTVIALLAVAMPSGRVCLAAKKRAKAAAKKDKKQLTEWEIRWEKAAERAKADRLEVSEVEASALFRSLEKVHKKVVHKHSALERMGWWEYLNPFGSRRAIRTKVTLHSGVTQHDEDKSTLVVNIGASFTLLGNKFEVTKDLNLVFDRKEKILKAFYNYAEPSGADYHTTVSNTVEKKVALGGGGNLEGVEAESSSHSNVKRICLTDLRALLGPYVTLDRNDNGVLLWAGVNFESWVPKTEQEVVTQGEQVTFSLQGATDGQTQASGKGALHRKKQVGENAIATIKIDSDVRAGITYSEGAVRAKVGRLERLASRFLTRVSQVYLDIRPRMRLQIVGGGVLRQVSNQGYARRGVVLRPVPSHPRKALFDRLGVAQLLSVPKGKRKQRRESR